MGHFIGRKRELEYLDELYSRPGRHTCAIYGRRRIGKSALIKKFCEDKPSIYIQFVDGSESVNLDIIRAAVTSYRGTDPGAYDNMFRALVSLSEICKEKKTILVFDEFPYLSSSADYIPSAVQRFIDMDLQDADVMLIICGSSIRLMTDETEDPKRPLYGRFPLRIKLGPLSPAECREFHPNMSDIDAFRVYLAVGGVPYYHEMMNGKTFEECVIKNFLSSPSPLLDEASVMIARELPAVSTCTAIVHFLARGSTRIKEISEKTRITEQACGKYLKDMGLVDMVERVNPMVGAPKHPLFRIKDCLIRFYFMVLEGRPNLLPNEDAAAVYKKIEHDIDMCMGMTFEDVCSDYICRTMMCKDIGKWWGRAGDEDRDVDIVAIVSENGYDVSLLCECKFRRKPIGFGVLNQLKDTAEYIRHLSNRRFVIFSAYGFDDDLSEYVEEYGKDSDIRLIDLDDIYSG
ncbi:MAG: AAA family ATPase [Candidatus Methanoplasma sp.]|jgi:AAA+ ATPase superfamily predicted ATPase|nr:AAA family ATPase [Candidatus Methanoplasma sp.]